MDLSDGLNVSAHEFGAMALTLTRGLDETESLATLT
jgi:hypothetical protein